MQAMATDVCLSVTKFSHATGQRADNTIPWTHITAEDIFVSVTGAAPNMPRGSLNMRVVQGMNVLEDVDISSYVDAALEIRTRASQAGGTIHIEQLPIFGITKEHLLAIRYRQTGEKPRRLQLRMQNLSECRQLVSIFQQRGMDFQEQRPRTAASTISIDRPTSLPYHNHVMITGRNKTSFEPPDRTYQPHASGIPVLESEHRLRNNLDDPRRFFRDGSIASQTNGMPPPRLLVRDESATPRDAVPSRPSSAQLYRAYTTSFDQIRSNMEPKDQREPIPAGEFSSSYFDTNLRKQSSSTQSFHADQVFSSTSHSQQVKQLSSDSADTFPKTAHSPSSTSMEFPGTLEHEIPPRRHLPFKRPESRQSESGQAVFRPGTSSMSLPPLRKPTLIQDINLSAQSSSVHGKGKSVIQSRPATSHKRTFDTMMSPKFSSINDVDFATRIRPLSQQPIPILPRPGTSPTISTRSSPSDERIVERKILEDRSVNIDNSWPDNPDIASFGENGQYRVNIEYSASATGAKSGNEACGPSNRTDDANRQLNSDREQNSLHEYAKQTIEDRRAILDDFVVEHLENPDFVTLCEDVENCWRRIGFG